MNQRHLETVVAVVIALAAACAAWLTFGTHIIGHDEGIYALTAASIRRTGEYRLTNLPSQPYQTKYPPLYPLVLAVVLKPDVPVAAQVIRLKTLNAALLAATVLLTAALLRRVGVQGCGRWASSLLFLALSPGMLSSTDWLMAEQLFTMLLVGVAAAAPETPTVRPWRVLTAAVAAGLAALTRSVGLAACIALVWYLARRLGRRPALMAGLVMSALVAPWWAWVNVHEGSALNPLEHYYVFYERSAWSRLAEDPSFAWRMLSANALGLLSVAPTVVGLYTPVTVAIGASLIGAGLFQARRIPISALLVSLTVSYVLVVIGHPMNLDRYVIPLIPMAVVMLALGLTAATTGTSVTARTWHVLAHLAMLALVAGNVLWAHHYAHVSRAGKNAGIGQVQPFEWVGFEEVIRWLRANTPSDAIIASGYDTTYAAYTGRRGLRPWLHEPEAYDPRYGRYLQWSSDATATARLLMQADVSYLIVDPFPAGGPGIHARTMLESVIHQPAYRWKLCFTSSDGRHQIYRSMQRQQEEGHSGTGQRSGMVVGPDDPLRWFTSAGDTRDRSPW